MGRKLKSDDSNLDFYDKESRNEYCAMLKQAKNLINTTVQMEKIERDYGVDDVF